MLTREQLKHKKASLQRRFSQAAQVMCWMPESTRKRHYAHLLAEESLLLSEEMALSIDAALENMFLLSDILDRRLWMLDHVHELDNMTFTQMWKRLDTQEESLCQ